MGQRVLSICTQRRFQVVWHGCVTLYTGNHCDAVALSLSGCGPNLTNADIDVLVLMPPGAEAGKAPAKVEINIGNRTTPITTDATVPVSAVGGL